MIVFLVTETRDNYERGSGGHPQRLRLEQLSGQPCLVQHMASEAHYREVKTLPRDFVLLASTPEVHVQAYRHKSRPLYGTQFHCEGWVDAYPAGQRVLENFFRLAGVR